MIRSQQTFCLLTMMLLSSLLSQPHESIHQIQHEQYRHLFPSLRTESANRLAPLMTRIAGPSVEVFGYHPYWMGTAWQNYNFNLLSTVAYFGIEVTGNGTISERHGWPVTSLISEAHSYGVRVVLVVILFDSDAIEKLLKSSSNRKTLTTKLLKEVEEAGADGVNIDFEGVPSSQRNNLTTFMEALTDTFHTALPGSQVTMATPAVDWSDAFDYKKLAEACDGLMIMGYGYHWSGSSEAGPVSPLTGWGTYNVTWTVNDYLNKTDGQKDKIILGCPYYGYQWPTASGQKRAGTKGTGSAKFYSEAEALAQSYGRLWDEESLTPWYRFENPDWFQGWYDDSLSLSYKYDLALEKGLNGIGIWALGYDGTQPELWGALADHFGATAPPTAPVNLSITNEGNGTVRVAFSGAETANQYQIYRWFAASETALLDSSSSHPIFLTDLNEGEIYYLRVTGKNDFGESPATEVLGVTPSSSEVPALIVNGFDRISGTSNTRDFIKRHAPSIQASNYTFDSCTNEAVETGMIDLNNYSMVDWILGEEGTATSSFSKAEQAQVEDFLLAGGALFVSGSEIGYDLVEKGDTDDMEFYSNFLKADYISDAAGGQQGTYQAFGSENGIFAGITSLTFDDGSHGTYDVDWPDGIKPVAAAEINLKFSGVNYDSRGGTGIEFRGNFNGSHKEGAVVYLTVPFEAIYPSETRDAVMQNIVDYFAPVVSISSRVTSLPDRISLMNVFPNPSNSRVTLEIQISSDSWRANFAQIQIIDILGRLVTTLPLEGEQLVDRTTVTWNGKLPSGKIAPSGVYTAVLRWEDNIEIKKFSLLR
ncbi:MAG: glycosyl hydrolase family 18 protein [Candidatus Marinimicrobia bacterium]|nr:glycosyl hydrolase family 18 protein [Candidatus Neomarinimicrobiota bacterium]MDP6593410.1 glycosyl hydrolase family 18 protein [Candidatus Neomarinimicrobiota bacterium]